MDKWSRGEKVMLGAAILINGILLGALSAILINYATADEISREAPAKVKYVYCAEYQFASKSQTCVRYATGYETRVVKRMSGWLWDYNGYEVVD